MMNKLKYLCLTAALLTALSGTAALPAFAASDADTPAQTEEPEVITGGAGLQKEPYLTVYPLGEQPDFTGAVVAGAGTLVQGTRTLCWWDIFPRAPKENELDLSEVDVTKPGTYPVYYVLAMGNAEPVRRKILELTYVDDETDFCNLALSQDSLSYEIGEQLDLSKVKLTTTGRTNGKAWSIRNETLSSHMEYVDASAFDSTKTGEYEIKVSAGGAEQIITASVIEAFEREKGDWDHDGKISSADAQCVMNCYVEIMCNNTPAMNSEQKKAADVNEDGEINASDAQMILVYYLQNSVAGIPTDWGDVTGAGA